jgi:hypothetical protein
LDDAFKKPGTAFELLRAAIDAAGDDPDTRRELLDRATAELLSE